MQIFTVAPVAHYTMHNAVAHYIPYSAKKKKKLHDDGGPRSI